MKQTAHKILVMLMTAVLLLGAFPPVTALASEEKPDPMDGGFIEGEDLDYILEEPSYDEPVRPAPVPTRRIDENNLFEVSNWSELKAAIATITERVAALEEGQTAGRFFITLLADITMEEVTMEDDLTFTASKTDAAGCYVPLAPGTDLTIRSSEGQHYTLTAPYKATNTKKEAAAVFYGVNANLTLRNLKLDSKSVYGIRLTGSGALAPEAPTTFPAYSMILEERGGDEMFRSAVSEYLTYRMRSSLIIENCEIVQTYGVTGNNRTFQSYMGIYLSNTNVSMSNVDITGEVCYGALNASQSIVYMNEVRLHNINTTVCYPGGINFIGVKAEMKNCSVEDTTRTIKVNVARNPTAINIQNSVIDMTGGSISRNMGGRGGGCCISASVAAFTDVKVGGNYVQKVGTWSASDGAGAFDIKLGSKATFTECTFRENRCMDLSGGAMRIWGADVSFLGGEFIDNTAHSHGGAICMVPYYSGNMVIPASATVERTLFSGNVAQCANYDEYEHNNDGEAPGGGAIFLHEGAMLTVKEGSEFTGNLADNNGHGGAIFVAYGSALKMEGGIISGNEATGNGGGVYLDGADSYEGIAHKPSQHLWDETYGGGAWMLLRDGLLSENKAVNGGGIYICGENEIKEGEKVDGASVMMEGGVITANHATEKGGGVYVSRGGLENLVGASIIMTSGAIYFNVAGNEDGGNTDPDGAGAEVYADGVNTGLNLCTAEQITNYIQSRNDYVPEKDKNVWFMDWYEDFNATRVVDRTRYMLTRVLDRVVYTPVLFDENSGTRDLENRALILDRSTALQVTKVVDGPSVISGETYSFELTLADLPPVDEELPVIRAAADGTESEDTLALSGGKLNFDLKNGESFTIGGLPAGTEFTLVEKEMGKADRASAEAENVEGDIIWDTNTLTGQTRATWQGGAEATGLSKVTLTNIYDGISITVKKLWDDANNTDGIRPDSIIVKLVGSEKSDAVELNETNNWTYTWADLSKYDENGEEIIYTVIEDELTGYTTEITGDMEAGFTITNMHEPEITQIDVKKVWEDGDDKAGIRSESVSINLLADGEVVDTVALSETNGWAHIFENLPKYENGEEIVYTVEEAEVPEGYEVVITGDAKGGFTVTNTHEIDYTEHYKYQGENLPREVLDTIPTRADRYKDGETVIPADPSKTEILVKGGKWSFKGWNKSSATVEGADVEFIGTWKFVKDEEPPVEVDYTEHYKYQGENLPREVLDTIPTRADRYKDGTTVIPADPGANEIAVKGGKWIFKGWDKSSATVKGADVEFIGTWEFLPDPDVPPTGDSSMAGLWLALMGASMAVLAGVVFFGKKSNQSERGK